MYSAPMKTPKAFISEYHVRRMRYSMDTGRLTVEWASRNPEVVNTLDIENTLKEPDTFLLGWIETHFELVTEQVKGQLIERFKEVPIFKEHPINPGIVMTIGDTLHKLQTGVLTSIPKQRSYEQVLFSLGWRFAIVPTGASDDDGIVITDEIRAKLAEQPEIQQCLQRTEEVMRTQLPPDLPELSDDTPSSEPSREAGRLDALELKMSGVETMLTRILGVLENGPVVNGSRSGEQRPSPTGREGDRSHHWEDPGEAATFRPELRPPVH